MVTEAEGTNTAMKTKSSSTVTEVRVEETSTALGVMKTSGVPAAGGTGRRLGFRKWTVMLTGSDAAPGETVTEEMMLTSVTGNAVILLTDTAGMYADQACGLLRPRNCVLCSCLTFTSMACVKARCVSVCALQAWRNSRG